MFNEDLTGFFSTDDFAVAATLDGVASGNVILDAAYIEALGIAGTEPMALARASDYAATALGKTLSAGGTTYIIRDRRPQDDGATVLLKLEKQ